MIDEKDPVEEQDSKNEDDEFHRIEDEQKYREQLEKASNPKNWP